MRSDESRRRLRRKTKVETLEERRVMSADPLGGLLGGSLQQLAPEELPFEQQAAPILELHQMATFDEQAPDFWLDTSFGSFEEQLGQIEQTLASAHGVTGLTQVRQDYGFLGTGQTVAVIDSGIAWDHYALGGGFGANYRVVGGWDFTEENDAVPYDDGPSGSHGTHVAGIVGGNAGNYAGDTGVAPGVDLVALRVFNDSGAGYFNWVEDALQWVHQNRNTFENPITAVNLSLGTNWNADTVPSWAMLEDEFAQLEADGIFIAVSAGNSFTTYLTPGLSYPAASSHVVPVMSTSDSGLLSYFSQRNARAIAAPGQFIRSTVPDYIGNQNGVTDDWASFSGTSMASPYVAGASVLIREAMEFVGYANITQQTIYDHMIATADRFFDSATNASYSRLNLANAIDALIPDDDFGSSIVDAYNMGTVGGSMEMAGLIGKIDDADYFTFTAGVTGTVSFTSSATHQLSVLWDTCNCASWSTDGDTLTLNVVAGHTYTVGLSSNSGLGYYDLAVEAEAAFTYTDWGTVTQSRVSDLANTGEAWYRIEASRSGYLTAEALFSGAAGNINLQLYDADLQLVASGSGAANQARVDVLADAGDEFYLKVTGTNGDVDFRLTNLVSLAGSTATVSGTAKADTFTFAAGASQHTVSVNGVTYQFAAGGVTRINFSGGAGSDTITMTGTAGNETATLRVGDATLAGSSFTAVALGVENVTVYGGGGYDRTLFYDSAGDDLYSAWSDRATMQGDGYFHVAWGFERTAAQAIHGGYDRAVLYDSAGNDVFTARRDRGVMEGVGYLNVASGFDRTAAQAIHGGYDRAVLYDSAGNDVFTARPDRGVMEGVGYLNVASGFDRTAAQSINGGYDRALFYDSSGSDVFTARPDRSVMQGDGYLNVASGFDRTAAQSINGGYDHAVFFDSTGNDVYTARADRGVMQGEGYLNVASGFAQTTAYASLGYDRAVLFDSTGDDDAVVLDWGAYVSGPGFNNEAHDFDEIAACLVNGGSDTLEVAANDYVFNLVGQSN